MKNLKVVTHVEGRRGRSHIPVGTISKDRKFVEACAEAMGRALPILRAVAHGDTERPAGNMTYEAVELTGGKGFGVECTTDRGYLPTSGYQQLDALAVGLTLGSQIKAPREEGGKAKATKPAKVKAEPAAEAAAK
jgi:hypothetical protein